MWAWNSAAFRRKRRLHDPAGRPSSPLRGDVMRRDRGGLWCLILVATALRLVVAACFGPGNDEAYHDLFAQHPDWSYFDHPPMLALVESAGLALVGFHASVFALRLGIVILFAGSTWLMARLTARHYGPAAGWIAAFALNATAYYGVAAATFALPDGPLVFFWLLTLDRLLVALEEPARVGPWAWVGLAWGGATLSKYQAVFLPVATLAYLAFEPAARHWLRRPGPYLAFALGLLVFAPVIFWNAHHGWASFAFQGGRALGWPDLPPRSLCRVPRRASGVPVPLALGAADHGLVPRGAASAWAEGRGHPGPIPAVSGGGTASGLWRGCPGAAGLAALVSGRIPRGLPPARPGLGPAAGSRARAFHHPALRPGLPHGRACPRSW